jgi:hypothetical protein
MIDREQLRLDTAAWKILRSMLVASDVDDPEPMSITIRMLDDRAVYVRSQSRGAIRLGEWPTPEAFGAAVGEVTDDDVNAYIHEQRMPATEVALQLMAQYTEHLSAQLEAARQPPDLWHDPEWIAIVRAYRSIRAQRPSQMDVADRMGFDTEQPLRDRLRRLRIRHWRAVHALIRADPDGSS